MTHEKGLYTWTIGRKLGFKIMVKSKCTWIWGSTHDWKDSNIKASISPKPPAVPSALTLPRQLSNPSASCLSRRKRKMIIRCFNAIPLFAVSCLLIFVLYYQTLNTFLYVEGGIFQRMATIRVNFGNASFAVNRVLLRDSNETQHKNHVDLQNVNIKRIEIPSENGKTSDISVDVNLPPKAVIQTNEVQADPKQELTLGKVSQLPSSLKVNSTFAINVAIENAKGKPTPSSKIQDNNPRQARSSLNSTPEIPRSLAIPATDIVKESADNVVEVPDATKTLANTQGNVLRRFGAAVLPMKSPDRADNRLPAFWQKQSRPAYTSDSQYGEKSRLLVLFTTFKRDPSRFRIHYNVIYNWASFRPAVVPVLYNDSTNPALLKLAREVGWVVRQISAYNKNGVPLLKQMYSDLKNQFPSAFIGFANGDVLFDEGLVTTLEGVAKHRSTANFSQTMVVGMRHNLFLQTRKLHWPHDVWIAVRNEAVEAPAYAEDYFFIYQNKFPWDILPDIVIGRPAYDNFLVAVAIKANVSVVDSSRTMSCVHQYGPDGLGAGSKNEDAEYNKNIIGDFRFDEGYLDQVPYETTFDPKGHIVVWKRNHERQQLLNDISRRNMSSHWKQHPGSYLQFVRSLNRTSPRTKLK